jgi:hypothetical protein
MFSGRNGGNQLIVPLEVRMQFMQPLKPHPSLTNHFSHIPPNIPNEQESMKHNHKQEKPSAPTTPSSSSKSKLSTIPQQLPTTPKQKFEFIITQKQKLNHTYTELQRGIKSWSENINALDESGFTILSRFIRSGDTESVVNLIQVGKLGRNKLQHIDVEVLNKDGTNALILSLAASDEITSAILSLKPNLNFLELSTDRTPLMIAILKYHNKIHLLFNYGVDIDFQNSAKQTALHIAVICKNYKAVQDLLTCNSNANIYDMQAQTPILLAIKNKAPADLVIQFLKHGALITVGEFDSLKSELEEQGLLNIVSKILEFDSCSDQMMKIDLINKVDFQKSDDYSKILDIAQKRYAIPDKEIEFKVEVVEMKYSQYDYYLVLHNDLEKNITKAVSISISDDHKTQEIASKDFAFSVECLGFLESVGSEEIQLQKAFSDFFRSIIKEQDRSPDFIIITPNYIINPNTQKKVFMSDFSEEKVLKIIDSFDLEEESVDLKHLEDLGDISDLELALLVHWSDKSTEENYPYKFHISAYSHEFDDIFF